MTEPGHYRESEHLLALLRAERERPLAERPDLDGRDPATLTDLEKLAYAYPEVAELVRERDALRDLVRAAAISATESDAELRAMQRKEVRALVYQAQNAVWNGIDAAHTALGDVTERIVHLRFGETP
jgi:hypothetical protein